MSGQRNSAEAIQRDRVASAGRYRNNRASALKRRQAERDRRLEERPFIGWDSEGYDFFICHRDGTVEIGPQRTMLFGCSVPGRYIAGMELHSEEMLALILEIEAEIPDAFHVGYAFDYDVNQILRDLPWRLLSLLKVSGKVKWKGYRISHVPHKMFTVSKDGHKATIYDVFGFYHCKYTTALEKYGVGTARQRAAIESGKRARGTFTYAELESVVIPYWTEEIGLLPELVEHIRTAAYDGGFRISVWHGPGALAAYGLHHNGVRKIMSKGLRPHVREAIRAAFAGGRFMAWQCGEYYGDIWTLDKNSAYVHAMAQLPALNNGKWYRRDPYTINGPEDISRFGLYHIQFDAREPGNGRRYRIGGIPERPYPLFHRDKSGKLTWPSCVDGWFWSPEARLVAGSKHARFVEAIEYDHDGSYPFRWVEDTYETRRRLKDPDNYSPAEKAYKWSLAAYYGAFARRVGWDRKRRIAPKSHELAFAGYITSHCRADIFEVADYAYRKGALISVDTDGVMATCDFPPSETGMVFGDRLGEWKQEHFSGVLYWQNGIYWLRDPDGSGWIEAKSRGVPHGVIPIDTAQQSLRDASFKPPYVPAVIKLTKKRYVGYRQALGGQFDKWRHWIEEPIKLVFGGTGKGSHFPVFCRACNGLEGVMHVVTHLPPRDSVSVPHKLPWLELVPDDLTIGTIVTRDFIDAENDIFHEHDLEDNL